MKILHVNDHLALKGGVETYLLSAIPHLERDGFEQAVVYGQGQPELVNSSFEVPEISTPGWGNKQAVQRKLAAAIDKFQPDVVHLHNIHNADPAAAFQWASMVEDEPQKRQYLLIKATRSWSGFAPEEARAAIESLSISERERQALIEHLED